MKRLCLAMIVSAAVAPHPVAHAQSADVLLNCTSCHAMTDSSGTAGTPYPDLRGQPARYIERQLRAYRLGWRSHRQMHQTATALGAGAAAMARAYADAPAPQLSFSGDPAAHETARGLIEKGDWARGIAPCASCHGISRADQARLAPRLHGQPAYYLQAQLKAYAEAERRSDPMGRMRAFAARLTAPEIEALAEYYAAWAEPDDKQEVSNDK